MDKTKLTEKAYWDDLWDGASLPAQISRLDGNLLLNKELDIFEKYLPKEKLSILEIGGAPGQYLAYFHQQFGYQVNCLDYSETGCEKTQKNFQLLNIDGAVYHNDLFSSDLKIPSFDIVYSMGFIEHFSDLTEVIGKHLALLKPGGILILGIPNLLGINKFFLKSLAPKMLAQHNLKTMDLKSWETFEMHFKLETIYKSYVGGFEPSTFLLKEEKSIWNSILFLKARVFNKIFHKNFAFLRNYNSKQFSGYAIGIYRKPKQTKR